MRKLPESCFRATLCGLIVFLVSICVALIVIVATALALPTFAETPAAAPSAEAEKIAQDLVQCEGLAFGSCSGLSTALASRDAVGKALAAMLRGVKPQQAGKIALALSLLDARTEVDALEAAAAALPEDPSTVDVRAAQARLGDARAAPALLAALKSQDARGQILAAGALGLLRSEAAVPALRQLLTSGSQRSQAAAAHALGMIGNAAAEPDLLALAAAPRTLAMVRAQALDALASLHAKSAVALATMLVDATPREVARAALRVLAAVPTPWADGAVLAGLDTPGARSEAAQAVVAMKLNSAGVHVLEVAVRDDIEPEERIALHTALAALKPSGAAVVLLKRFQKLPLKNEPDEAVRILRLLPALGDKTIVADLVPLLRLDSKFLVNHVVFALENLTGMRFGSDEKPWREYVGLDKPNPKLPTKPQ